MTRRPTESLTPFEETLTNLPQEEAPADLQDRCLAALDEAVPLEGRSERSVRTAISRPQRKPIPWNHFAMAAAASLLIALGSIALLPLLAPAKAPHSSQLAEVRVPSGPVAMGPAAPPPAAKSPAQMLAEPHPNWQSTWDEKQPRRVAQMENESGGGRAVRNRVQDGSPMAPAPGGPAAALPPTQARDAIVASPYAGEDRDRLALRRPAVTGLEEPQAQPVVPEATQPWYDRSADRKKIAHRDMEIETPDVEQAYNQVVAIIEKAEGFIAHEDLVVRDREPDTAQISARIPAESFENVLQQLRGLGKLVVMTGRSEDRTQEYRSRGADIRALSVTEQELITRYEREQNPARKEALKWELQSLRKNLKNQKETLQALAAEVNYSYLELTITEGSAWWQMVKDKSRDVLPLAMALALVALPFFVVALMWRRRG